MNILTNSEVHKQFVTYCLRSPELAQIWVGRYVLMPDHLHVFVSVEDSESLSRWVGSLKKYLSYFWRSTGLVGPFWQQSFFDHLLRNKESYTEKWTYVVQNPVRAGLAEYASDWPYSGEIHEQWWDEV